METGFLVGNPGKSALTTCAPRCGQAMWAQEVAQHLRLEWKYRPTSRHFTQGTFWRRRMKRFYRMEITRQLQVTALTHGTLSRDRNQTYEQDNYRFYISPGINTQIASGSVDCASNTAGNCFTSTTNFWCISVNALLPPTRLTRVTRTYSSLSCDY